MGQGTHDFVAFRVQEQELCLDVAAVREIRSATRIVPLPSATEEYKGLMNLRGVVLPVVDMTKRLGLPAAERSPQPVIIVAEAAGRLIGLDVDAVDDIVSADDGELQPVPGIEGGSVNQFIRGILNRQGRLLCILDLNRLLPATVEEVE